MNVAKIMWELIKFNYKAFMVIKLILRRLVSDILKMLLSSTSKHTWELLKVISASNCPTFFFTLTLNDLNYSTFYFYLSNYFKFPFGLNMSELKVFPSWSTFLSCFWDLRKWESNAREQKLSILSFNCNCL